MPGELVATGQSVSRDSIAPKLRLAGIRKRNGEWGPYVEAGRQAVAQ